MSDDADGQLKFTKLKLSSDGKSVDTDGDPLTAVYNPENIQLDAAKAGAGAITTTLSFSVTFDYSTSQNQPSIPLPVPNPFASSSSSSGDKDATFPVKFFDDRWAGKVVASAKPDDKGVAPKPKLCRIAWSNWLSFDGELTTLTAKYTYFNSKGVPLRVTLSLKFQEWKPPAAASSNNPSSSPQGAAAPTPPPPPPAKTPDSSTTVPAG